MTHWKRPWCWESLKAKEEGGRGWNGEITSQTQWTWIWANSQRSWRTEEPSMLQSMRSQRVGLSSWTTTMKFKKNSLFALRNRPTLVSPTNKAVQCTKPISFQNKIWYITRVLTFCFVIILKPCTSDWGLNPWAWDLNPAKTHSLPTEITLLVSEFNEAQVFDVSSQKECNERQRSQFI